jgi:hypothetical protein
MEALRILSLSISLLSTKATFQAIANFSVCEIIFLNHSGQDAYNSWEG